MSTPISAELELISLSALQYWKYCPRQCGLIHLELVFDDNLHTLRGQAVHARVDLPSVQSAKDEIIHPLLAQSLPLGLALVQARLLARALR